VSIAFQFGRTTLNAWRNHSRSKPGAKVLLKNFSTNEHEGIKKHAGLTLAAEHVGALDG